MTRGYKSERPQSDRSVYEIEDAEGVRATAKALLVRFDDLEEVWIPLSHIHANSEVWKPGTTGKLVVTSWLANEKKELADRGEFKEAD